jgi:hypothetical protein
VAGRSTGDPFEPVDRQLVVVSEKTVQACTGHIFAKLGLDPGPDDYRRVRAVLTYLQAAVDES